MMRDAKLAQIFEGANQIQRVVIARDLLRWCAVSPKQQGDDMKTWLRLLVLFVLPTWAAAQGFPTHAVQMLIPYPPGGTTDIMARRLQEPLQKALGQTLIVENKAGASGVLAAREVARAKPDGRTLLFINSGIVAVTPHARRTPASTASRTSRRWRW